MDKKQIAIFGGGTVHWIAPHLALSAPAFGNTARQLEEICKEVVPEMDPVLYLTKMAGGQMPFGQMETNQDVADIIDILVRDDVTKIVFFTTAMVDFDTRLLDEYGHEYPPNGKHGKRLKSSGEYALRLKGADKVIKKIRKNRKDIFLVGFKQTFGATEEQQYIAGLELCKQASCNLVLANDAKTRLNMVITPEEAKYYVTKDRQKALAGVVDMAKLRSNLTFTRSTVIAGETIPWDSEFVPESLRKVVDYCIARGAYKPFQGVTVGHFAAKMNDRYFLTSKRRTNFNDLKEIGLVRIQTDGPDTVLAYGYKPSVGGQSQRIVFNDHPGMDCIVHAHVPLKPGHDPNIPQVSQYAFECGSHECGENTSRGLKKIGNLWVVYLQEHGPNIVFSKDIDPQEVIDFIETNFDLEKKTGGFVSIKQRLETPSTLDDFQSALATMPRNLSPADRAKYRPGNFSSPNSFSRPTRRNWNPSTPRNNGKWTRSLAY